MHVFAQKTGQGSWQGSWKGSWHQKKKGNLAPEEGGARLRSGSEAIA